jgi:hypothetical protein
MRVTGIRTLISLQKYRTSPGPRTCDFWPQSNEDFIQQVAAFIEEWVKGDALRDTRDKIIPRHLQIPSLLDQPFALLTQHPILCGLIQFLIYSLFKRGGTAVAGAWGSVLYVAHLYNACRQGGYLQDVWTDMELLMDIHNRDSLFAGKVPKTPEEWKKTMSLMLGASLESVAQQGRKGKRDHGMRPSKKGPKGLATTSVSPVFDSFLSDHSHPKLSVENVHVILSSRMSQTQATKPSKQLQPHHSSRERERQTLLQSQWSKSHKMTSLQLLEVLPNALEIEELALRFDYFSSHVRCFEVLRQVRDAVDEDLRGYFDDGTLDNDTKLATVVHCIFVVAAGNTGNPRADRTLRGLDVGSVLMTKAADVVKTIIEREGHVETEKLRKICMHWKESFEPGDEG